MILKRAYMIHIPTVRQLHMRNYICFVYNCTPNVGEPPLIAFHGAEHFTLRNVALMLDASALASNVLPVPGGPYSSTPCMACQTCQTCQQKVRRLTNTHARGGRGSIPSIYGYVTLGSSRSTTGPLVVCPKGWSGPSSTKYIHGAHDTRVLQRTVHLTCMLSSKPSGWRKEAPTAFKSPWEA